MSQLGVADHGAAAGQFAELLYEPQVPKLRCRAIDHDGEARWDPAGELAVWQCASRSIEFRDGLWPWISLYWNHLTILSKVHASLSEVRASRPARQDTASISHCLYLTLPLPHIAR